MSKARFWTKLWITWLALSLAAIGCDSQSKGDASEGTGSLELQLTTTAGGASYRLANFYMYIYGNNTNLSLYDTDPSQSTLSATLGTGNYQISVSQWELQRADSQGIYHRVEATLESNSYYQYFSIYNGATTTVTFSFLTDGVIVNTGSGHLGVKIHVDVADAACVPLGSDCPSGFWCAPSNLTGADLHCVSAGSTAVGQPCQSPTECVANASCFASSSGTVCAPLCTSGQFNQPCDSGGVCRPVASDYGFCDGGDGGAPSGGGTDGGGLSSTEAILAARGGDCLSCSRDNGCLDPAQFGGTCEDVAGNGSIDGTRSYTEMCVQVLNLVFASGCASTLQMTPCLCGTTDAAQCLAGSATPNGPVYPYYVADFGPSMSSIMTNFTIPSFGSGRANAIVQCAAAFGCNCF